MTHEPASLTDESEVLHMNRRTKVCIWIIVIGLANFLAYTVVYDFIGGEAVNGDVRAEAGDDGRPVLNYFLVDGGRETPVGRGVWMYSAVHSISIWITVGAVLLAMLTLAKDRIVSSMRSSIVRGRTFITILATVVTLISVLLTVRFALRTVEKLLDAKAALGAAPGAP